MDETLKEQITKSILSEIENAEKRVESARKEASQWFEIVDKLPLNELGELGATAYMGSFMWPLTFNLPLSKQLITKVEKLMTSYNMKKTDDEVQSWKVYQQYRFVDSVTNYTQYIVINFKASKDTEDVCQIRQIGEVEKVSKEPIYEIICPEGIAEEIASADNA
jgi:hypothetical protein